MSFARVSDTAAYDPRTLAPLEHPDSDERTVDEVFGFSVRLCAECGGKETNRRASRAMTLQLAGSPARMDRLMTLLVDAGVWTPDGTGWELVNDPNYLHLLPQVQIERSRARGRDENNDALTVPARLRDGDNCRYCNKRVDWGDRKSLKGATWEHVNIANQPTILAEFVVCCFECNREPSNRGELLPPPAKPFYGKATKDFVKKRLGRWPTPAEIAKRLEGQRPSSESAASSLRTDGENATQDTAQRPEEASENADGQSPEAVPKKPPGARRAPPIPGSGDQGLGNPDSPGRDGSGRVGSGRASSGPDAGPGPALSSSKRSRRGKGSQP